MSKPTLDWAQASGGGLPTQVYPLDDLRDHVIDGGPCWCRAEENIDGSIIHNSLDGRELFETGQRKLS